MDSLNIKVLAKTLAEWLKACFDDDSKILCQSTDNHFENDPSDYSLPEWIDRILLCSKVSPSCLIQGCVLLCRIRKEYPALIFSMMNIRRLILIATMVVAKLNEDISYTSSDWVWVSDDMFNIDGINNMEHEFLYLLHYRVFVDVDEYDSFCMMLMERFQTSISLENVFCNALISSVTFIPLVKEKIKLYEASVLIPTTASVPIPNSPYGSSKQASLSDESSSFLSLTPQSFSDINTILVTPLTHNSNVTPITSTALSNYRAYPIRAASLSSSSCLFSSSSSNPLSIASSSSSFSVHSHSNSHSHSPILSHSHSHSHTHTHPTSASLSFPSLSHVQSQSQSQLESKPKPHHSKKPVVHHRANRCVTAGSVSAVAEEKEKEKERKKKKEEEEENKKEEDAFLSTLTTHEGVSTGARSNHAHRRSQHKSPLPLPLLPPLPHHHHPCLGLQTAAAVEVTASSSVSDVPAVSVAAFSSASASASASATADTAAATPASSLVPAHVSLSPRCAAACVSPQKTESVFVPSAAAFPVTFLANAVSVYL